MPSMQHDAMWALKARKGDLDALRQYYGIGKWRALETVLLSIIDAVIVLEPPPRRKGMGIAGGREERRKTG